MSAGDTDQKRDYCTINTDPSLTVPAVRMVVVAAVCRRDVASHRIYPVLAIQACNQHKFSRASDGQIVWDHMPPPSVAAAEEYGWEWDWSDIDYDYIIMDEDYDIGPATLPFDSNGVEWEAFVADWPAAEDEDRLRDEIAELLERARITAVRLTKDVP